MTPSVWTELIIVLVLAAMIFLPGSAILIISGQWRRWSGLQRPFVATGLGLAFYPVLFYLTRLLLPGLGVGRWPLIGLLLAALVVTLWGAWRENDLLLRPRRLEWLALLILGLTLASRFWFAHQHPFPAWSDSLHHTLLTDLTAESGRLPRTLEPYFPNVLDMYHLGLYALSGSLQIISGAPAHTALLWTAQFLNGLCGIGIYLVLDRFSGRPGAVLGLAVAGLFSAHPALWANWGRFTQLASVVLLPIAWTLFLELTLRPADEATGPGNRSFVWLVVFAALSGAAVFLTHFRVGVFYALLLVVTVGVALLGDRTRQRMLTIVRSSALVGLGMLLLALPALWGAADAYLGGRAAAGPTLEAAQQEQVLRNYFEFPLTSVPYLVAPLWLLLLAGVAAVYGLIARKRIVVIQLLWTLILLMVGNFYLLGIPALNFTNLGAVLIMLYIPLSLIIGAGFQAALIRLPPKYQASVRIAFIVALLGAGLLAFRARATAVEPYRHFVTDQDVRAMAWIDDNTPADAVFAINTYRWLPEAIHGTDAGYWIPYFSGRRIVTTSMLADGLSQADRQRILAQAEAADALESDLSALATLRDLGVNYIYIGAAGDFSGPGLQLDQLTRSDGVRVLYDQDGVAVLQILP